MYNDVLHWQKYIVTFGKSTGNHYLWTVLSKTMSTKNEDTDYHELYQAVETEIRNYRENIKDARRARRNCSKDERRIYRNVVKYNQKGLREAKVKRRLIEMQTKSTWWLWLLALTLCIIILITVPGAPVALVLAPVWIMVLLGIIYILISVKK